MAVSPGGLASDIGHRFGHGLGAERLSARSSRAEPGRCRSRFDLCSKAGWGDALPLHVGNVAGLQGAEPLRGLGSASWVGSTLERHAPALCIPVRRLRKCFNTSTPIVHSQGSVLIKCAGTHCRCRVYQAPLRQFFPRGCPYSAPEKVPRRGEASARSTHQPSHTQPSRLKGCACKIADHKCPNAEPSRNRTSDKVAAARPSHSQVSANKNPLSFLDSQNGNVVAEFVRQADADVLLGPPKHETDHRPQHNMSKGNS